MPRHDFFCRSCGAEAIDVVRSIHEDPRTTPPQCGCGETMEWVIPIVANDLRTDGEGAKAFQKFSVDVDGHAQTVDSLHALRRIERESEQRFRNGEGEPLRFRLWNQNRSNRDVNSFGAEGSIGEQVYASGIPAPKSRKLSITKHGTQKPDVAVVPGCGTSPLRALKG